MVEVKGNIKPKTEVNKYTVEKKINLQHKKEQIMVNTNESKKAKALWLPRGASLGASLLAWI